MEGAFFGDGDRRSVADGVVRLRFTTFDVPCRVGVEGCGLVVCDREMDLDGVPSAFLEALLDMKSSSSLSKIWLDGGVNKPGLKPLVSSADCSRDTPRGFNVDLDGEALA